MKISDIIFIINAILSRILLKASLKFLKKIKALLKLLLQSLDYKLKSRFTIKAPLTIISYQRFASPKSTIKTVEKGIKYVQS